MSVNKKVKSLLQQNGRTQKWTIQKMNEIDPTLGMDRCKMSAIINETRKMTGDELLAFCMALKISPDEFASHEKRLA